MFGPYSEIFRPCSEHIQAVFGHFRTIFGSCFGWAIHDGLGDQTSHTAPILKGGGDSTCDMGMMGDMAVEKKAIAVVKLVLKTAEAVRRYVYTCTPKDDSHYTRDSSQ